MTQYPGAQRTSVATSGSAAAARLLLSPGCCCCCPAADCGAAACRAHHSSRAQVGMRAAMPQDSDGSALMAARSAAQAGSETASRRQAAGCSAAHRPSKLLQSCAEQRHTSGKPPPNMRPSSGTRAGSHSPVAGAARSVARRHRQPAGQKAASGSWRATCCCMCHSCRRASSTRSLTAAGCCCRLGGGRAAVDVLFGGSSPPAPLMLLLRGTAPCCICTRTGSGVPASALTGGRKRARACSSRAPNSPALSSARAARVGSCMRSRRWRRRQQSGAPPHAPLLHVLLRSLLLPPPSAECEVAGCGLSQGRGPAGHAAAGAAI